MSKRNFLLLINTAFYLLLSGCSLKQSWRIGDVVAVTERHESDDQGKLPRSLSYLTSWKQPASAIDDLLRAKTDAYILAFARWNNDAKISSSDGLLEIPSNNSDAISQAYSTWTNLAHKNPGTQFLISFGGQEFDDIWEHSSFLDDTESLAQSIAKLISRKFPVYNLSKYNPDLTQDNAANPIVGYVELDGVDFDFEHRRRLSSKQNQQMRRLAIRLRELVGRHKIIALTTYHVGADPSNCIDVKMTEFCSFRESPRSKHHGEIVRLLNETHGIFDLYNVMAYDAGADFDYVTAMQNYANYIKDRGKLRLGVSINKQWSSEGPFLMSVDDRHERIAWQTQNGYGGYFVWALGASTEGISLSQQVDIFNTMQQLDEALKPVP